MPLGFHINKEGRPLPQAIEEDIKILDQFNFEPCAQVFVKGPRSSKDTLTEDDKFQLREYINHVRLPLVIHGAYIDVPWGGARGTIHNIKQELQTAAYIGAQGVVIHLGAGASNENVLRDVLKSVADLPKNSTGQTLWLEINTAKPGTGTFETPEKLDVLFDRIRRLDIGPDQLKIGLCIDTAHLFSCGVALRDRHSASNWINKVEQILDKDTPIMLHLNDSASALGSGKDIHQKLCHGNLWRDYHPDHGNLPFDDSGLAAILDWADENNIITILERHQGGVISDLTLLSNRGYFQRN